MSDDSALTEAAREYAAAYVAHYSERDWTRRRRVLASRLRKSTVVTHTRSSLTFVDVRTAASCRRHARFMTDRGSEETPDT